jgi:hypothetical protein
MSTTVNGRRKKQLKACEKKQDRLGASKNSEGRKACIHNLQTKIAAKKSYTKKVEDKPAVEKKGKKGKK